VFPAGIQIEVLEKRLPNSNSDLARLGLAIEQDAFVESVTKDAAGIQVGFLPGVDGTGHHVAPDAATSDGLVDFVVAKRPLI
jgi:hypothetical protein